MRRTALPRRDRLALGTVPRWGWYWLLGWHRVAPLRLLGLWILRRVARLLPRRRRRVAWRGLPVWPLLILWLRLRRRLRRRALTGVIARRVLLRSRLLRVWPALRRRPAIAGRRGWPLSPSG